MILTAGPDSPAEIAGLRAGDVVVDVNGQSPAKLRIAGLRSVANDRRKDLRITVKRNGGELPPIVIPQDPSNGGTPPRGGNE